MLTPKRGVVAVEPNALITKGARIYSTCCMKLLRAQARLRRPSEINPQHRLSMDHSMGQLVIEIYHWTALELHTNIQLSWPNAFWAWAR